MGSKLRQALALATGIAMVAGCAKNVGDINRVQPNYIDKSILNGTWYFHQTITSVPYENGEFFQGLESDMDKVRFQITENAVIAYRAYQFIPNGDTPGSLNPHWDGQPIAAWAITKHFDITRQYNPATGEQTNVIQENDTDRPWYQRQYMRVDWSKDLISNTAGLDYWVQLLSQSPADYYPEQNEEADPDRIEIDPPQYDSNHNLTQRGYIGFINKYNVMPDDYSCQMEFNELFLDNVDCGPTTIKVRTSILQVNPADDYVPQSFPDQKPILVDANGKVTNDPRAGVPLRTFTGCAKGYNADGSCVGNQIAEFACTKDFVSKMTQLFGAFDPTQDCNEYQAQYFMKFGYFRTVRDNYDRKYGIAEDGRQFLINRHNIWQHSHAADWNPATDSVYDKLLPYAQRQIKPIHFYVNVDFPQDLFPTAAKFVDTWNQAFKQTVASLWGKSCADPECSNIPNVVTLSQNDCSIDNVKSFVQAHAKDDPGLAGVVNRVAGGMDQIAAPNLPNVCAALDYNTVGTNHHFVWERIGDLRYSFIVWINQPQLQGPLGYGPSSADPETGEIISANNYIYGAAIDTYSQYAADVVKVLTGNLSLNDVVTGQNIRDMIARTQTQVQHMQSQKLSKAWIDYMHARMEKLGHTQKDRMIQIPPDHYMARLQALKNTPLEKELLIDDQIAATFDHHWRPGMPVTDDVAAKAAPSTWMSPQFQQLERQRVAKYATKNVELADFFDDSILGLAEDLANQVQQGTLCWEDTDVTPTSTCKGSVYQTLREDIFQSTSQHEIGHDFGLRHNFAGSNDALNYFDEFWADQQLDSQTQIVKRMKEFRYSSIMDYGAKFSSDIAGLGKYDIAAIKFGYGDLIETWQHPDQIVTSITDANGAAVPVSLADALFLENYQAIPSLVGGYQNLSARQDVDYGQWQQQYVTGVTQNAAAAAAGSPAAYSSAEVPFKFCSDEFAGTYQCDMWDEGASQQEVVDSYIQRFQNYYFFDAFKRDRFNFNPFNYFTRVLTRYFENFITTFQYYYWFGDSLLNFPVGQDMLHATVDAFNALGATLAAPSPGTYCQRTDPTTGEKMYIPISGNELRFGARADEKQYTYRDCDQDSSGRLAAPLATIPLGVGRYYTLDFSNNYEYYITRAGSELEKIAAMIALTNSTALFLFRTDVLDPHAYSLGFYKLFRPEMLHLLGGVISNQQDNFTGVIQANGSTANYLPVPIIDLAQAPGQPSPLAALPHVQTIDNYTMRFYALYFGMSNLTSPVDDTMDFSHFFKVSLRGTDDDIDYISNSSVGVQVASVTDPITDYTYAAAKTNNDGAVAYGYQLVEDAQQAVNTWTTDNKSLQQMAQAGNTSSPQYLQLQSQLANDERIMASKLEFLDDVRNLEAAYKYF